MDQQTLMQRMILAGVNIHNPQEVFDFFHNHLNDYIPLQEKGEPEGVATLDEAGKVPLEQLPEGIGSGGGGTMPELPDGQQFVTSPTGKVGVNELEGDLIEATYLQVAINHVEAVTDSEGTLTYDGTGTHKDYGFPDANASFLSVVFHPGDQIILQVPAGTKGTFGVGCWIPSLMGQVTLEEMHGVVTALNLEHAQDTEITVSMDDSVVRLTVKDLAGSVLKQEQHSYLPVIIQLAVYGVKELSIGVQLVNTNTISYTLNKPFMVSKNIPIAVLRTEIGVPNGVVPLNANTQISRDYLPFFTNRGGLSVSNMASIDPSLFYYVVVGELAEIRGEDAVAVGYNARTYNLGGTAVGSRAGASGEKTTALGYRASASFEYAVAVGAGTTAYRNSTCIGYGAIAQHSNCSVLGSQATTTAHNQVQLGNSTTTVYAYGAVQNRSDLRDKADIQDADLGLEFINQLRPVKYRWDYREDYLDALYPRPLREDFENDEDYKQAHLLNQQLRHDFFADPVKDGSKVRVRYHYGLIAQEFKETIDRLGVDHAAYQDHAVHGGDDVKSIGYMELIPNLIKAVQELSKQNGDLLRRIELLESS